LSREYIAQSERVVIKIGTNVLTERDNRISIPIMESIVQQISGVYDGKRNFIIVSSGAIALGLSRLGIKTRPSELNLLQAAASVGQSSLMHAYEELFHKTGLETAQILLTYDDVHQRRRYLNVRNTIFTLWSYGLIPVVNENDTVAFEEIRFGDNDLLAAHLSIMIDADLLLILTDIDGVYDKNPKQNRGARILKTIPQITHAVLESARGKGSLFSSGGMESKLFAARIATKGGVGVIIGNGKAVDLKKIITGEEIGSYCPPSTKRIKGRKKWIAFNSKIEGSVYIDRGGEKAIVEEKKSLLPVGVLSVKGEFGVGGNISIRNEGDEEIARGLSNFSSEELNRIKGLRTKMIPETLGVDTYFEEVVHRDNMVILINM